MALVKAAAAQSGDPECLTHLGGGSGDVECYGFLSNALVDDSKKTYLAITGTIPKGNSNVELLKTYLAAQNRDVAFCKLPMQAPSGWTPDSSKPLLNMYDSIYAECVYNLRKNENTFLHGILESVHR
jgi:hypothetical protein